MIILAAAQPLAFVVLLHPILTLAAIVITANHYWLDAIVATALFGCVAPRPLADQACSPNFARIASGIGVES